MVGIAENRVSSDPAPSDSALIVDEALTRHPLLRGVETVSRRVEQPERTGKVSHRRDGIGGDEEPVKHLDGVGAVRVHQRRDIGDRLTAAVVVGQQD